MADPSIPFNSYFDQQGQDNILNKLMDFKANRWQDAVAKGFQGVQQAVAAAQKRAQQQKQQQALAGIMAQLQQNPTGAQAGPQMPTGPAIQGPQGYAPPNQGPNSSAVPAGQTPMQKNPTSGIGAPTGQNSGEIMSLLMQSNPEIAGKVIAARMGLGQKQSSPWRVVPGMLSKGGKPVQQNEQTGEVREASLDVTPTGRGNANFGTGSINWDSATPEDKNLAKGLYEGRIRTFDLGYRDRSVGTKLANEYAIKSGLPPFKSYAGDVAGKTAGAFSTGKPGMNTLSLNTALGHVDTAYDAYQKIENTDQKWLNQPLNKLKLATGDPNVARLGVTLNALRGELANVFKGSGGTDQEIASWMSYLNDSLTPSQVNAVVPQIDELLRSRLSALDYQRSSGMSGRGEQPLLSPKASQISERFKKKKLDLGPASGTGGWSYVGPVQ